MPQHRIWLSIVLWAAFAVGAALLTFAVLTRVYPSLYPGLAAGAGYFSVQAAYLLRRYARYRGWAMASYAPAPAANELSKP